MVRIEENTKTNEAIKERFQADQKNVEDFLERKTATFNVNSLRRLVLSEISYKGAFKYNRICGFTRKQIVSIIQYPERYSSQIIRLSRYMYLKSGYYKRLIDYFVNMAVINWTIDLTLKTDGEINPKTIKSNYYKYTAQVNKFKLDNRISDIMKKLFIEDACFGFVTETNTDISIYWIEPNFCEIKSIVNGNIYQYAVNRSLLTNEYFDTLPPELQKILEQSKETQLNNMVMIPYENSLCLKYNNDFTYLYPTFFGIISSILEIDDFKDLAKAKTEADAYKLVCLEIPTTDDGQIAMGDEIVTPFTTMTKSVVPESWGVVPTPMKVQLLESKSTASDDSNKVEDAVENFYTECGISKALISSASSGSELKYSIKVDSSDIYRIYRMLESWVDLQMKLRGFIYKTYQFEYNILPTTIFDINDYVDTQLKLAQVSAPVKGKLLAANNVNTAKLLGNSLLENSILKDVFDEWTPLSTSYTQSGDGSDATDESGRPKMNEEDLSDSGTQTREDDENNKANRDI